MSSFREERQMATDLDILEQSLTDSKMPVTIKDWFHRPILPRPGEVTKQSIPRADLQAVRPPAVKHWAEFRSQAQTFFESVQWPVVEVPESWRDRLDCILSYFYTSTSITSEQAVTRLLRIYDPILTCCHTKYSAVKRNGKGFVIQTGTKNLVAVMMFGDREYNDLSKIEEYVGDNDTCIQRLVERIYGHLIWTGVSYGVLVTSTACYFVCIDPSTGSLIVSPDFKHEAKDFTAKQGLAHILDLASKQAPFDMLANIGSSRLDETPEADLLEWFGGSGQILRMDEFYLGELLGTGNGAAVYDATLNGITVALKVAHMGGVHDAGTAEDSSCSKRLAKEVEVYEALKNLQGIVVPQVHASGLIKNRVGIYLPFLAIERIDGVTLDAVKTMPLPKVYDAVKAVLAAYEQLHAHGYGQGSVKEVNVMLRTDGRAVIIDFGRGYKIVDKTWNASEEKKAVFDMLQRLLGRKMYEEVRKLLPQSAEDASKTGIRERSTSSKCESSRRRFDIRIARPLWSLFKRRGDQVPIATRNGKRRLIWSCYGRQLGLLLVGAVKKLRFDFLALKSALRSSEIHKQK